MDSGSVSKVEAIGFAEVWVWAVKERGKPRITLYNSKNRKELRLRKTWDDLL